MESIAPGAVIGILGGGQLGRMLALAAAPLGFRCHVFCPEPKAPAAQVAAAVTVAEYDDSEALRAFANAVDIATFEFENIPLEAIDAVGEYCPVRPGRTALKTAQDRFEEKSFLDARDIATARFAAVDSRDDLIDALHEIGCPAVLKTRRFGYDGKGQWRIRTKSDADAALAELEDRPAILEAFVDFQTEVSVVAARGADGVVACFDLVENRHVNHILDTTVAPAQVGDASAAQAREIARQLLQGLDYVGVIGVEMFLMNDGALLVNEIAPRVHNSGHWTIEGAATSQFEQHIRAIAGLPLGSSERLFDAEMKNLIGDEFETWPEILNEPGAHLHLYGKAECRPGRKMGHVTRIRPRKDR